VRQQESAVEELAGPAVDACRVEGRAVVGCQPVVGVVAHEVDAWIVADDAACHGLGCPVDFDAGQPRGRVHAGQQPRGADTGAGAQLQDAPTGLGRGQGAQRGAGAVLARHRESHSDRALLRREDRGGHVDRFVDHARRRPAPACSRRTAATRCAL